MATAGMECTPSWLARSATSAALKSSTLISQYGQAAALIAVMSFSLQLQPLLKTSTFRGGLSVPAAAMSRS
jgi:hypothetical protein